MDDLKNVFDKIQKAELILNDLEKKREDKTREKIKAPRLSKEHQNTIDSARQSIASIKDKLGKELAVRTLELDKCQEDLLLLQTRLKTGEIPEDVYNSRSKHLVDKIKSLEKKVLDIHKHINAKFAEDVAPIIESNSSIDAEAKTTQEPEEPAPGEDVPAEAETSPARAMPVMPDNLAGETTVASPVEQEKEPATNNEISAGEEKEKEYVKAPVVIKKHKPSLHLHPLNEPVKKNNNKLAKDILKRNRALLIVTSIIIIGLLLMMGALFIIPATGSNIGNAAPDFAMQLTGDNTSSLSALRGKNVVLVFWDRDFWDNQFFDANGAIRKLYTPDKLNQLYQNSPHSELTVIAIASGTNNNEIDDLIRNYGIKFPVIVDSFGKLRSSYNITEEPTYVFIDKSGIIRARVEGPIINMSDLEQIVYAISQKSDVKTSKPPITDVIIQSKTEKSAVISWVTSEPTTTQVDIDGKNIQTVITSNPTTLHSLALRDLEPASSYHVRIVYNINNINVSEHSFSALSETIVSKRYNLTTTNTDTSFPEISNISVGFVTDSSVTVSWKTDEPSTSNIDFGAGANYQDTYSTGDTMSIWHTIKLDSLKPDTLYSIKIRSKDISGKEGIQEIEPVKTMSQIEIAPVLNKRAPNFTLYALDGTKFTLNQFQGKRVLLNFWLESCAACEAEMPLIQTVFNKYNRDELVVLAVNVHGDTDKVNFYAGSQKLTFPILLDTFGDVDSIYRPPYFPTTYFIDSKGIIQKIATERFQTISEIDDIIRKIE